MTRRQRRGQFGLRLRAPDGSGELELCEVADDVAAFGELDQSGGCVSLVSEKSQEIDPQRQPPRRFDGGEQLRLGLGRQARHGPIGAKTHHEGHVVFRESFREGQGGSDGFFANLVEQADAQVVAGFGVEQGGSQRAYLGPVALGQSGHPGQ